MEMRAARGSHTILSSSHGGSSMRNGDRSLSAMQIIFMPLFPRTSCLPAAILSPLRQPRTQASQPPDLGHSAIIVGNFRKIFLCLKVDELKQLPNSKQNGPNHLSLQLTVANFFHRVMEKHYSLTRRSRFLIGRVRAPEGIMPIMRLLFPAFPVCCVWQRGKNDCLPMRNLLTPVLDFLSSSYSSTLR